MSSSSSMTLPFSDDTLSSISSEISIIRRLSESKYPVYLAKNSRTNQLVATKAFPHNDKRYQKEKSMLQSIDHPHIVKLQSIMDQTDVQGSTKSCLNLEYAPYGDLLDIIQDHGRMPEKLVRTLFHQLLDAISYLHEHNIAHMDIKVDNILIDGNFHLKLTDFDLAQEINSVKLEARGTPGCRAPEVINGECHDFKAADVYSLAVALFILLSGCPPYSENNVGSGYEYDSYYKVMRADIAKFWNVHSRYRGDADFYTNAFKALFYMMIQEDPHKRITINDIKRTHWYQGPIYENEQEIQEAMKNYLKL